MEAFGAVNRDCLWRIMKKFGFPEQFMQIMLQLFDGMTASVTTNGTISEAFTVTNGVKWGCEMPPTLFSLMTSAMLMDACRTEHPGDYSSISGVCGPQRVYLQSPRPALCVRMRTQYCDGRMQRSIKIFTTGCAKFRLIINMDKTVFMHQP
ncbi:unnamed protein product [Schistocephalus solidus]|uniref:Reverse transcriptase domain-containing protein n=1 Tax=Schistocephalus solidus TaxID=70667 RepID=A0A183SMH3_SCHSO|nr:unnamed protein product [Schistocephalus solidus]